ARAPMRSSSRAHRVDGLISLRPPLAPGLGPSPYRTGHDRLTTLANIQVLDRDRLLTAVAQPIDCGQSALEGIHPSGSSSCDSRCLDIVGIDCVFSSSSA